jgi:tetratricopeptide (TPR) repeat protein
MTRTTTGPARLRGEISWLTAKLHRTRKRDSHEALELRRQIANRLVELRDPAAEAWLRELVPDLARVFGARHRLTLASWFGIALRCGATGRVDEALALFSWLQETYAYVLGPDDPVARECGVAAADTLFDAGRYAAAITAYRALPGGGREFLLLIAQAQSGLGRFAEAEQTLREAEAGAGPAPGEQTQLIRWGIQAELGAPGPLLAARRTRLAEADDPASLEQAQSGLAYALLLKGEAAEAVPLAEAVLAARLVDPGPEDRLTWDARVRLSQALAETDRLADADHYARAALAAAPLPPGHPLLLRAQATVARVHFRREEWAEAVVAYEYAVEGLEVVLGAGNPETLKAAEALAAAREAAG